MSSKINDYDIDKLKDLCKKLKNINNDTDYHILGNIILEDIKNGETHKDAITEISRGTYFQLHLMSNKVISLLKYYLEIKEENDKINYFKNNINEL